MTICKQITFTARAGEVETLKQLLSGLVEPSRHEPGCLRYELYQQADRPEQFIIVESWASADTLEQHKRSDHFRDFKARADSCVAAKTSVSLNEIQP